MVASSDEEETKLTIRTLNDEYSCESTDLKDFLGFEIIQNEETKEIHLSAQKFITKTLKESEMINSSPVSTPVTTKYDIWEGEVTNMPFRTYLEKLIYIYLMYAQTSYLPSIY